MEARRACPLARQIYYWQLMDEVEQYPVPLLVSVYKVVTYNGLLYPEPEYTPQTRQCLRGSLEYDRPVDSFPHSHNHDQQPVLNDYPISRYPAKLYL